jgi:hypothetical protein
MCAHIKAGKVMKALLLSFISVVILLLLATGDGFTTKIRGLHTIFKRIETGTTLVIDLMQLTAAVYPPYIS